MLSVFNRVDQMSRTHESLTSHILVFEKNVMMKNFLNLFNKPLAEFSKNFLNLWYSTNLYYKPLIHTFDKHSLKPSLIYLIYNQSKKPNQNAHCSFCQVVIGSCQLH